MSKKLSDEVKDQMEEKENDWGFLGTLGDDLDLREESSPQTEEDILDNYEYYSQVERIKEVMEKGFEAFLRGDLEEDNPYAPDEEDNIHDPELMDAWKDGYFAAWAQVSTAAVVYHAVSLVRSTDEDPVEQLVDNLKQAVSTLPKEVWASHLDMLEYYNPGD